MLKGKKFLHKWIEDAEGREGRKSIYNVYRIPPQLEKMLGRSWEQSGDRSRQGKDARKTVRRGQRRELEPGPGSGPSSTLWMLSKTMVARSHELRRGT